jgi:hypothetical protein
MRLKIALAILAIVRSTSAYAMSDDEKKCILMSAEQLPTIVGTEILNSRVAPTKLEPGLDTKGMILRDVELDVKAAGVTQTFVFTCVSKEGFFVIDPKGLKG